MLVCLEDRESWCFFWVVVLLMEELLHQLIGGLSHYLQGVLHPRWCRISSINSRNRHVYIYIYTHSAEKDQAFFPEDLLATSRLNIRVFFFLGILEGVAGLKLSQDPPDGWLQLFPKIPYRLEWQSMVNKVMLPVSS